MDLSLSLGLINDDIANKNFKVNYVNKGSIDIISCFITRENHTRMVVCEKQNSLSNTQLTSLMSLQTDNFPFEFLSYVIFNDARC